MEICDHLSSRSRSHSGAAFPAGHTTCAHRQGRLLSRETANGREHIGSDLPEGRLRGASGRRHFVPDELAVPPFSSKKMEATRSAIERNTPRLNGSCPRSTLAPRLNRPVSAVSAWSPSSGENRSGGCLVRCIPLN